jgi:hypothetical protein
MSSAIIDKDNCSFQQGWQQLTKKQAASVRSTIMQGLGMTTKSGFYKRMRGETEPTFSEKVLIETAFKKYGITKIWGAYEPAS